MPSSESATSSTTSRRSFLAATGVVTATAVTGCTGLLDFVGSQILGHVNVFNGLDRRVSGSITVTGPDGETRLDETFDLVSSNTESSDEQMLAVVIGGPETEKPFAFRVGTSFSEFVPTATPETTS